MTCIAAGLPQTGIDDPSVCCTVVPQVHLCVIAQTRASTTVRALIQANPFPNYNTNSIDPIRVFCQASYTSTSTHRCRSIEGEWN